MEDVLAIPEALELRTDLLVIGPPLQICISHDIQLFKGQHMSLLAQKGIYDLVAFPCKAFEDIKGVGRVIKFLL